jgi:hypothetical protein
MAFMRSVRVFQNVFLDRPVKLTVVKPMPAPDHQTTIGDMHANAVKQLFVLIQQGYLKMPEADQREFIRIYQTDVEELTQADIANFDAILKRAVVDPRAGAMYREIGDKLCDRGSNDYFILKIMERLGIAGTISEETISNHTIEFVECLEKIALKTATQIRPPRLQAEHGRSMQNLGRLVARGLVSTEEVLRLYDTYYKPCLRALSYGIRPDGKSITIYSHAGIGLETIRALAKQFKVAYHDATVAELAQTIDQINIEFLKHVKNNTVHTLYTDKEMWQGYDDNLPDNCSPIAGLCWNRRYHDLDRPTTSRNGRYQLAWVHGHDPDDPYATTSQSHVINIDNNFGKADPGSPSYKNYRSIRVPKLDTCEILSAPQVTPVLDYENLRFIPYGEWVAQRQHAAVAESLSASPVPAESDEKSDRSSQEPLQPPTPTSAQLSAPATPAAPDSPPSAQLLAPGTPVPGSPLPPEQSTEELAKLVLDSLRKSVLREIGKLKSWERSEEIVALEAALKLADGEDVTKLNVDQLMRAAVNMSSRIRTYEMGVIALATVTLIFMVFAISTTTTINVITLSVLAGLFGALTAAAGKYVWQFEKNIGQGGKEGFLGNWGNFWLQHLRPAGLGHDWKVSHLRDDDQAPPSAQQT